MISKSPPDRQRAPPGYHHSETLLSKQIDGSLGWYNLLKVFLRSIPWIKYDSKETFEVGTLASLLKLMKENKGFCPDGAQENLRNGKASTCNGALDKIYAKDLYYDD